MEAVPGGLAYGMKYQARCIANVTADSQTTTFLVGTLSPRDDNEVHLIQISPFGTELTCEGLYSHPHEIWDLASCPFDRHVFSTVYASGCIKIGIIAPKEDVELLREFLASEGGFIIKRTLMELPSFSCGNYGAALWRIPEVSMHHNSQIEQIASLDAHTNKIQCTLWWPSGRHDQLVSIDQEAFYLWSLDSSTESAKVLSKESVGMVNYIYGGAWDPHDISILSIACESSIQFWDLRSMKQINAIGHPQVRDLNYNPKKQHIVVTAGEDSQIRIWDLRVPNIPLKELSGHTHWTWRVRYNPAYDEFILSAGTDSTVNLWQTSPIQGGESRGLSMVELPTDPVDPLVRSYSDFEDSVYGIAWSSQEPWIFASLSYDGRVVVESVPQTILKEMKKAQKM